jgi:ProQ/FINO family
VDIKKAGAACDDAQVSLPNRVSNLKIATRLPDPKVTAVLELLAQRFPRCFSVYEARRRPLKIGIHLDIIERLDGVVTPAELSIALRVYVTNPVYRNRLVVGTPRIDLDGAPVGVVAAQEETPPPQRVKPPPPPPPPKRGDGFAGLRAAARARKAKQQETKK